MITSYGSSFRKPTVYIRFFLFVESSSPSDELNSSELRPIVREELPLFRRETIAVVELRFKFSKTDLFLEENNRKFLVT